MGIYKKYRYLILAILVLIFGKLTEWNALFPRFDNSYSQKFQKIFDNKERELQNYILYIEKAIKNIRSASEINSNLSRFNGLMDKEGYGLFVYRNDSLIYWSDNSVVIGTKFTFSTESSNYLNLKNAWFVTKIKEIGNIKIVGLLKIKQVYLYENNYLVNEFQRDFNFPSTVKISSRQVPDGYPIFNSNGMYIFSLVFDKTCQHRWFQYYIPVISYFLTIILLGFFFCSTLGNVKNVRARRRLIILVILVSVLLKFFSGLYHYPAIFYELDLFNPQNMAISTFIPSLGDLLLWAMVIFFISYLLYTNFRFLTIRIKHQFHRYSILVMASAFITLVFLLMDVLIENMILNSSISFEAHKVLLLNAYSFLGYLIMMMIFASFGLMIDRVTIVISGTTNFKSFAIVFVSTSVIINLLLLSVSASTEFFPFIFLLAIVLLIAHFRIKQRTGYQYSGLVLIIVLFALYTVDRVIELTLVKNKNETTILASNLANQHDQVAEYLMEESSANIQKDPIIVNYLLNPEIEVFSLATYLENNYFDGYFEKYNLQIIPCFQYDSLYLAPPG